MAKEQTTKYNIFFTSTADKMKCAYFHPRHTQQSLLQRIGQGKKWNLNIICEDQHICIDETHITHIKQTYERHSKKQSHLHLKWDEVLESDLSKKHFNRSACFIVIQSGLKCLSHINSLLLIIRILNRDGWRWSFMYLVIVINALSKMCERFEKGFFHGNFWLTSFYLLDGKIV